MIEKSQEIYVGMLIVMMVGTFLTSQSFFLFSIAYFLFLVSKSDFKVVIPGVPGLKLYIFVLLYSTIEGFILYNTRNVIRDLYYVLPTLLWILIGANEAVLYPEKNLKKTIFIYGAFVTLKALVLFLKSFSLDFYNLRMIFGLNVYEVGFILPISVICILGYKEVYISKMTDRVIVALMALQVMLSLGRIAILQPIIIFAVLLFMEGREAEGKRTLKKISELLFVIIVVFVILFYIMPSSMKNPLMEKVMNSFAEVDSSQEIMSVSEAMNHWRAYEIQAAQRQWKSWWPIPQIFGKGMGKGVELQYIPYTWVGIVENNEIPLLHNGFYTMLIKGGILGIGALLWMFLGNAKKGLRISKYKSKRVEGNILLAISLAAIANTYVVRGPIQQGTFLIWAVLVGWLNVRAR